MKLLITIILIVCDTDDRAKDNAGWMDVFSCFTHWPLVDDCRGVYDRRRWFQGRGTGHGFTREEANNNFQWEVRIRNVSTAASEDCPLPGHSGLWAVSKWFARIIWNWFSTSGILLLLLFTWIKIHSTQGHGNVEPTFCWSLDSPK